MMFEPPPSGCACPQMPGCYGAGGWHFRALVIADVRERFPSPENTDPESEPFKRWERSTLDQFERIKAGPGRFIAYEPCPAYRQAVTARRLQDGARHGH